MTNPLGESAVSIFSNDKESECFSSFLVVRSRSCAVVNPGDGGHLRFDLGEAHTEAANLYELTRTPVDPEASFFIASTQIARLEPAVIKLALRRFGLIEVSCTCLLYTSRCV